jgi:general secretion pathway protein A
MILGFYKLNEQPFGVTPDPRYLYLTASHREALASLQYGVAAGRGFTALIAGPGMGKTTLLFDFLSKARQWAHTAFLFQAHSTLRGLLRSLLKGLGIQDDAEATKVTENLRAAKIKIWGAVHNKRTFPIPESLYNLL